MIDLLSTYWKLTVKRYIDEAARIITSTYTRPRVIVAFEERLTKTLTPENEDLFEVGTHEKNTRKDQIKNRNLLYCMDLSDPKTVKVRGSYSGLFALQSLRQGSILRSPE